MFVIEKNIPAVTRGRRKGVTKYPFGDMEKGDSFFVPFMGKTPSGIRGSIYHLAKKFFGEKGRVSIAEVENEGVKGVRVWLIK